MKRQDWHGVFPAVTTPFQRDGSIDWAALSAHAAWMAESRCRGIVPLGSLGEGGSLSSDEKIAVIGAIRKAAPDLLLVPGISGASTGEAIALAGRAEDAGCDGLMLLPPYAYRGDRRERLAHFNALLGATTKPCMLYNNPVAYGTDVLPDEMNELAVHENLQAVKESSADVRRITMIRELLGGRLAIFVGVDDLLVEGVAAGAVGWIAGLVNALPLESVRLFELASESRFREAQALYEWFLPLLRLDTVPKFVQLIKLVQAEVARGAETVRLPRLALPDHERQEALALIHERLACRPAL